MKIFKKVLCLLLAMLLSLSAVTTVMASGNIKVILDGKEIKFDVPPQIIKNRTMVPLRAIFEALGASVDWDEHTRTVVSVKGDIRVSLTVKYTRIDINGENINLDCAPLIVDGRTLVPVRAVSEAFKTKVDWIESERTVLITTKDYESTKPKENNTNNNQSSDVSVYEDSKVKINYLRVEKSKYDDEEVKVYCEVKNKTNEPLTIFCDALSFNGYTFNDTTMADKVPAGSVTTVDTTLDEFDFSLVDINNIKSVGGQFRVKSDNKSFDTYNATFMSKNLDDNTIRKTYPAVSGKKSLYSDDKVNIYFDYAENDDEDFEVYLTVQNKTDGTIRIQNNNLVVSGNKYTNTIMSDDILAYTTGNVKVKVKNASVGSVSTVSGEFRIISGSGSFKTYETVIGNN